VKLDGDRIEIDGLDRPRTLWIGDHELIVSGEGIETVCKSFTVRRGANPPLRVDLVPAIPEPVPAENAAFTSGGPSQGRDPGTLIFSSSDGPDGRGRCDLSVVRRAGEQAPWGEPASIRELNTSHTEFGATLRFDGHEILFVSDRPGGSGGQDLWRATRQRVDAAWSEPEPVLELCTEHAEGGPCLSWDGLTVYFHSRRRPRLEGGSVDIYRARRENLTRPFGVPEVVTELNSPARDCAPCLSADGRTIYFASTRPGSQGWDIWYAQRPTRDSAWSEPKRCPKINGPGRDYGPFESGDGRTFYFVSSRPLGTGTNRVWMVHPWGRPFHAAEADHDESQETVPP
jgi:hypothetical protein